MFIHVLVTEIYTIYLTYFAARVSQFCQTIKILHVGKGSYITLASMVYDTLTLNATPKNCLFSQQF